MAILRLFASENQTLLIRWDALLVFWLWHSQECHWAQPHAWWSCLLGFLQRSAPLYLLLGRLIEKKEGLISLFVLLSVKIRVVMCDPTLTQVHNTSFRTRSVLLFSHYVLLWFSFQFNCSVVSDSFWPSWPAAHQTSLSITNSWSLLKLMSIELVMPSTQLILCCPWFLLPSIFPALGSFQMSRFFTSGGQGIGVSALASVLPMKIKDWFP